MKKYYIRNENKSEIGPFSTEAMQSMAKAGMISITSDIRPSDQSLWTPLTHVPQVSMFLPGALQLTLDETDSEHKKVIPREPSIESNPLMDSMGRSSSQSDTPPQTSLAMVVSGPRPWVRFWARSFDLACISAIVNVAFVFACASSSELSDFARTGSTAFFLTASIMPVFFWMLVEPFFLSSLKTTPGKWLLRTTISFNRPGYDKLTAAFERSFLVWVSGMGCGIPLINLVAYIISYTQLKHGTPLSWDKTTDCTVSHNKIGTRRTVFFIVLLAIITIISSFIYNLFLTPPSSILR